MIVGADYFDPIQHYILVTRLLSRPLVREYHISRLMPLISSGTLPLMFSGCMLWNAQCRPHGNKDSGNAKSLALIVSVVIEPQNIVGNEFASKLPFVRELIVKQYLFGLGFGLLCFFTFLVSIECWISSPCLLNCYKYLRQLFRALNSSKLGHFSKQNVLECFVWTHPSMSNSGL